MGKRLRPSGWEPFSDDEVSALDLHALAWQEDQGKLEEVLHRLVATVDFWYEKAHEEETGHGADDR